jgi:hypothetical protein
MWQRTTHHTWGYAQGKVLGRTYVMHKYMYEKLIGPVPKGLQLDHRTCSRRACINPWHLEPVTPVVNTRRSRVTKLTAEMVLEIRRLYALGATPRELSKKFRICEKHADRVARRRLWTDV